MKDLAYAGTRHDTNPTRMLQAIAQMDLWWLNYFKSADRSIRERAKAVLKEIDR